jgi:hypothetical protein
MHIERGDSPVRADREIALLGGVIVLAMRYWRGLAARRWERKGRSRPSNHAGRSGSIPAAREGERHG